MITDFNLFAHVTMFQALLFSGLTFIAGVLTGKALESKRWRDSVGQVMRIESNGRLYRVTRDV